jgi:hypothetical protein
VVVYICNPSYTGAMGGRIVVLDQPQKKKLYLKNVSMYVMKTNDTY